MEEVGGTPEGTREDGSTGVQRNIHHKEIWSQYKLVESNLHHSRYVSTNYQIFGLTEKWYLCWLNSTTKNQISLTTQIPFSKVFYEQPNVPTAKAKQMHLNWNPLGFVSELSHQKSATRFPPDVWQAFFCRSCFAVGRGFRPTYAYEICASNIMLWQYRASQTDSPNCTYIYNNHCDKCLQMAATNISCARLIWTL